MFLGFIENHILDAPDCVDAGKSPSLNFSTVLVHCIEHKRHPNNLSEADLHVVLDYQSFINLTLSHVEVLLHEYRSMNFMCLVQKMQSNLKICNYSWHLTVLTSPWKRHENMCTVLHNRTPRLCKYTLCKWPEITITAAFNTSSVQPVSVTRTKTCIFSKWSSFKGLVFLKLVRCMCSVHEKSIAWIFDAKGIEWDTCCISLKGFTSVNWTKNAQYGGKSICKAHLSAIL